MLWRVHNSMEYHQGIQKFQPLMAQAVTCQWVNDTARPRRAGLSIEKRDSMRRGRSLRLKGSWRPDEEWMR